VCGRLSAGSSFRRSEDFYPRQIRTLARVVQTQAKLSKDGELEPLEGEAELLAWFSAHLPCVCTTVSTYNHLKSLNRSLHANQTESCFNRPFASPWPKCRVKQQWSTMHRFAAIDGVRLRTCVHVCVCLCVCVWQLLVFLSTSSMIAPKTTAVCCALFQLWVASAPGQVWRR
jgi:hypothetical protein